MHRSDSSKIAGDIPATDGDWCIGAHLTYIDVSAWTRPADVDAYARGRGISRQEAIQELVNVGSAMSPATAAHSRSNAAGNESSTTATVSVSVCRLIAAHSGPAARR